MFVIYFIQQTPAFISLCFTFFSVFVYFTTKGALKISQSSHFFFLFDFLNSEEVKVPLRTFIIHLLISYYLLHPSRLRPRSSARAGKLTRQSPICNPSIIFVCIYCSLPLFMFCSCSCP